MKDVSGGFNPLGTYFIHVIWSEFSDVSFQLEQEFSAKAEKLKANEREKLQLLSNQKQVRF